MTLLERMARPDALPVMARVYLVALGTPRLAIDEATLAHMGALYDGAEPVTAADVSALSVLRDPRAVLREEQAPAPDGLPTLADMLAPPRFTRAIIDDGREPDRDTGLPLETDAELRARIKATLASEAPPPPCAMCDGATWIKTVDYTDAGVTPRTDPCPDCARGAR